MKTYLIFCLLWLTAIPLLACPVCGKQQPKGFAGITHGTGPESSFDYWILYGSIGLVIITLALFVRYLIRPESHATRRVKQQFNFEG